jgi:hypothetical protein
MQTEIGWFPRIAAVNRDHTGLPGILRGGMIVKPLRYPDAFTLCPVAKSPASPAAFLLDRDRYWDRMNQSGLNESIGPNESIAELFVKKC